MGMTPSGVVSKCPDDWKHAMWSLNSDRVCGCKSASHNTYLSHYFPNHTIPSSIFIVNAHKPSGGPVIS